MVPIHCEWKFKSVKSDKMIKTLFHLFYWNHNVQHVTNISQFVPSTVGFTEERVVLETSGITKLIMVNYFNLLKCLVSGNDVWKQAALSSLQHVTPQFYDRNHDSLRRGTRCCASVVTIPKLWLRYDTQLK